MSMSVCLSARVTQKPCSRTSQNFLCMLPVAMAQSFSDDIAIRYLSYSFTDDVIFSYFGTSGWTGMALCHLPVAVPVWPTGLAGRLAGAVGVHQPGEVHRAWLWLSGDWTQLLPGGDGGVCSELHNGVKVCCLCLPCLKLCEMCIIV